MWEISRLIRTALAPFDEEWRNGYKVNGKLDSRERRRGKKRKRKKEEEEEEELQEGENKWLK